MYNMSLFPEITRPSRVISHCATLIDNIFTNDMENNTESELLINDISDNLPVFTVYDIKHKKIIQTRNQNTDEYRHRNHEHIGTFTGTKLQNII